MSEHEISEAHGSERRIQKILHRARREVGIRDLLTFCIARIWTVLLILGAVCSAWYAAKGDQNTSPGVVLND